LSTYLDKTLIFSRIKSAYGFKTDAQLARFLGIPTTTLSSWKRSNRFDIDLLYSKLVDISWDFLFYGKGMPFLQDSEKSDQEHHRDIVDQLDSDSDDNDDPLKSILANNSTNIILELLTAEIKKLKEELKSKSSDNRHLG